MALLWADNFDNYGTTETFLTDGLYAQVDGGVTLVSDPDPLESGRCINFAQGVETFSPRRGNELRWVYPSAQAIAGFSFRLWCDDLPESIGNYWVWSLSDINNTGQVVIRVLSDGSLEVARGDMGSSDTAFDNSLGTTAIPVISTGAWNHVEIKATISDTVGTVEIRVNGVTVFNLSSADTQASGVSSISQVSWGCTDLTGGTSHTYRIKDFIAWDSTGSQNNDFLGTCHVYTLNPDSDSSFNWDTSSGTDGFSLIDETTPNDSDYIGADDTPPAASVFTLEDLPPDIVSIKGLIPVVRTTKTDGGDGTIQTGITSNGSTDLGGDKPITTSYTFYYDVSELSPDTGVAYTPTEVDAALLQLNRTT